MEEIRPLSRPRAGVLQQEVWYGINVIGREHRSAKPHRQGIIWGAFTQPDAELAPLHRNGIQAAAPLGFVSRPTRFNYLQGSGRTWNV